MKRFALSIALACGVGSAQSAPVLNYVTSSEDAVNSPLNYHARIYGPDSLYGLEVDHNGDLYFAEPNDHRVYRINRDLKISSYLGNGGGTNLNATPQGVTRPRLAAMESGRNFVIESYTSYRAQLLSFDNSSGRWNLFSNYNQAGNYFYEYSPDQTVYDSELYLTRNRSPYGVYKVNSDGSVIRLLGNGTTSLPTDGSTIDASDIRFSSYIEGIAADESGNFYISDGARIYFWDVAANTISHYYGSGGSSVIDGGDRLASGGNVLYDLEYDSVNSELYFLETNGDLVAAIDIATGTVRIVAGGGSSSMSDGADPLSIDFGNLNHLELDTANNRVFFVDISDNYAIISYAEDTDGDMANDYVDKYPGDDTQKYDYDFDGQANALDTDNDNDGLSNSEEVTAGTNPYYWDTDNDGASDSIDAYPTDPTESSDYDGDGYGDNADLFPYDPSEWADFDGDGIGDNSDPDLDNDGVLNEDDAFELDPNESADTDGDGVGDNADDFPNDATETVDADGDGVGANADFNDNDPSVTLDSDGDNVPDELDDFPDNPAEQYDADNDGEGDNADLDDDNDGTEDTSDAFPFDPTEQADADSDGVGDNSDFDSTDATVYFDLNNNGIADKLELRINHISGVKVPSQLGNFDIGYNDDTHLFSNNETLALFQEDDYALFVMDAEGHWVSHNPFAGTEFDDEDDFSPKTSLNNTQQIVLGPNGNFYIADWDGNVFQWSIDGELTTIIAGIEDSLEAPYAPDIEEYIIDIYAGGDGNLYVAYEEGTIYRLNFSESSYTRIVGDPGFEGPSGDNSDLETPDGENALTAELDIGQVAVSDGGRIYFTDGDDHNAVRTVDPDGTLRTLVNHPDQYDDNPIPEEVAPRAFPLDYISDLEFANDQLFIRDSSYRILSYDIASPKLNGLAGFSNSYDYEKAVNTPESKLGLPARTTYIGRIQSLTIFENEPHFTFSFDGCCDEQLLGRITEDGYLSALSDWNSFHPLLESFYIYKVDNAGTIYASNGSGIYQLVGQSWQLFAGEGDQQIIDSPVSLLNASFGRVADFTFDADNRLVIADQSYALVYEVREDGLLHRLAGQYRSYGQNDSDDALTGSFSSNIRFVGVDPAGQVVVADSNRIRRVNSDNSLSTLAGRGSLSASNAVGQPSENVQSLSYINYFDVMADGRIQIEGGQDFLIDTNGLVSRPSGYSYGVRNFKRLGQEWRLTNSYVEWRRSNGQYVQLNQDNEIDRNDFSFLSAGQLLADNYMPLSRALVYENALILPYRDNLYIVDYDKDGDGWVDYLDLNDQDAAVHGDIDGDGIEDRQDPDIDGDGIENASDILPTIADYGADTDSDSIPDSLDADDDNDRLPDYQDPDPLVADLTSDSDGDGYADSIDAFPNNPNEFRDTDGDGIGDNEDTDDDNDGVLDVNDLSPVNPNVGAAEESSSKKKGALHLTLLLTLLSLGLFARRRS